MNIIKTIFIGSIAYIDAIKKVNDSVNIYTSSIVDLGIALNMKLLEEARELKDSIETVSQWAADMSISSEEHFKSLHAESHQASSSNDQLLKENISKFHFAISVLYIKRILIFDRQGSTHKGKALLRLAILFGAGK